MANNLIFGTILADSVSKFIIIVIIKIMFNKNIKAILFTLLYGFSTVYSAENQSTLRLEIDKDGVGYVRSCSKTANGKISIPESFQKDGQTYKVQRIGTEAFKDCGEISRIEIPTSVTTIQKGAFKNCTSLDSVIIPNSVLKMERSIFWGCHNLTFISIPVSVSTISTYTFVDCKSLRQIKLPASVKEIGKECFSGSAIEEFTLPPFVEFLGDGAFKECKQLKSVKLNNKINIIRKETFMECYNLKEINIPDEVKMIESKAFQDCIALRSVSLNNASLATSFDSQNQATFKGCTNLTTIDFGQNVRFIPPFAFENCTNLQSIVLPSALLGLHISAFMGSGVKVINVPAMTSQLSGMNMNISQLQAINVAEANKEYASEDGILFSKEKTTLYRYPADKQGDEYTIPAEVKKVADNAFMGCKHLKTVNLSKGIENMGKNVFDECPASVY